MKNAYPMKFVLAVLLTLSLAACADSNYGQKQIGGTILGGALGGLAGSQIGSGKGKLAATAIGTLLGALAGSEAGKSLDRADKLYAAQTSRRALETNRSGQSSQWSNPDSGNSGSVTPTRTYKSAAGRYCREFQQTVVIDGRQQSSFGTACREADGSWRIVNS
jgi:surface antigen